MRLLLVVLALGAAGDSGAGHISKSPEYQPEQVHIAFGEKSNDILITWSTMGDTGPSVVTYGAGELHQQAVGNRTKFVAGGASQRAQYIHRAALPDLRHNTTYEYKVGSALGVSETYSFHVPPEGSQWPARVAVFGDMGVDNAHALPFLQKEAEEGNFDLLVHVGDFAYDMDDDESRLGDQFMRQIQPMAARVPYMTCVGNHEEDVEGDFRNYRARFSMPGGTENMFYSFDLGPVHFVAFSTEFYYKGDGSMLPEQYEWLQRDLTVANYEENRSVRPWLVLLGHRPMYCSDRTRQRECHHQRVRTGHPDYDYKYGLEPLLQQHDVDLVFAGHEHAYERLWPVYNGTVYNGSLAEPYTDPGAPVHVISGSAGCRELLNPFVDPPPAWSAFREQSYGYTRLVAHNQSHMYMEQLAVPSGEPSDSFWLVKHSHGVFRYQ